MHSFRKSVRRVTDLFIRKLYYISISWDTRAELKRYTVALAKLPWVVTPTIYSIIILQRIASPIEYVIY